LDASSNEPTRVSVRRISKSVSWIWLCKKAMASRFRLRASSASARAFGSPENSPVAAKVPTMACAYARVCSRSLAIESSRRFASRSMIVRYTRGIVVGSRSTGHRGGGIATPPRSTRWTRLQPTANTYWLSSSRKKIQGGSSE
jgi:hypothetical protein